MLGPIAFIALPLIGLALLWALHLIYAGRQSARVEPLQVVLSTTAWLLILAGLIAPMVASFVGLAFVLATGVIFSMALMQYRASERRALVWMLGVAAERGLPLNIAARAFAAERSDAVGRGALRLAETLEAGMSLPDALRHSGNRVPSDMALAVRLAYETGGTAQSLLETARAGIDRDRQWRPLFEKCMYFIMLIYVGVGILSFVMIKIVPAFEKIFGDFDVELPAMTQIVITASHWVYSFGLLLPLAALAAVGFAIVGSLYYIGWLQWEPPPINWFTRPYHRAALLTALARLVEEGGRLPQGLSLLAQWYPQELIRARLGIAERQTSGGVDWCDALLQQRLLTPSDAAVLKAAERARNLPWAMREMAARSWRRVTTRVGVLNHVVMPLAVVAMALPVAFLVIALFLPLIKLIQVLT
jgi:type II secretory pathway component PulF